MFLQANLIFLGTWMLVILLNTFFSAEVSISFFWMNWQVWHKLAISSLGRAKNELAEMSRRASLGSMCWTAHIAGDESSTSPTFPLSECHTVSVWRVDPGHHARFELGAFFGMGWVTSSSQNYPKSSEISAECEPGARCGAGLVQVWLVSSPKPWWGTAAWAGGGQSDSWACSSWVIWHQLCSVLLKSVNHADNYLNFIIVCTDSNKARIVAFGFNLAL